MKRVRSAATGAMFLGVVAFAAGCAAGPSVGDASDPSVDGAPVQAVAEEREFTTQGGETHSLPGPSDELELALADGVVVRNEYEAGFRRYRACMEALGIELVGVVESAPIISFSYGTQDELEEEKCYSREFYDVDLAWQLENGDRSADISLLAFCLDALGLPDESDPTAKPARRYEVMLGQIEDGGLDMTQCNLDWQESLANQQGSS
ncbi:hypothetical protein [Oerskovia sp. KBS0722]|jgi:hypothetical protein|uniref:hypothetical protein n=1 Tax=Oerskovia sp. KBS0722 TaxID=1179673 RepID=UPI00110E84C9|nr:hypothetical protein [Oerskovia sp. KBS0722]QDW61880.1 hypothetical protein FFI11_004500 [Oerskovia sp. KBS0722]